MVAFFALKGDGHCCAKLFARSTLLQFEEALYFGMITHYYLPHQTKEKVTHDRL